MAAGSNYGVVILPNGAIHTSEGYDRALYRNGFQSSTYKVGQLIDDAGLRGENFLGLAKTDNGVIIDENEYVVNAGQSLYEKYGYSDIVVLNPSGTFYPLQDGYEFYAVYFQQRYHGHIGNWHIAINGGHTGHGGETPT